MEIVRLLQISVTGLFLLIVNSYAYDPAACIQCRNSHMCNPPTCFCCRNKMPLQAHTIPQMVFFTFDDAVNPQVATYYRQLFTPKRRNPNGCPVSMTLFVSHRNTVYGLVKEFYDRGMEIASHSVTHGHMNTKTFIREARKQKENLSKRAGIPSGKITGWRSPFLEPVGDLQPSVLKDLGYEYDATLTVAKKSKNDNAVTPFTLDFGWPYDCKIKPCPTRSHKGFWEVPVVTVKDYLNKYDCVYVDGCNNPPPTEDLAFKFLWNNFQRYYTSNRAPMGINMHASWFYYPERKAAMDRFIKALGKLDDVYVVSIKQVIEWLKHPTPLQDIKTFQPWQCNENRTSSTLNQETSTHRRQRQRPTDGSFRLRNTLNGNFIASAPRPSFPSRTWQSTRHRPFVRRTMPAPMPPLVPNIPMVRFWWRPPQTMVPPMRSTLSIHRNMQRQEEQQRQKIIRRQRLEEARRRQFQAEDQARILEQKRQEERRQQDIARQAALERKRLNDLEIRRRNVQKIQEIKEQKQLEREQKKAEEQRGQEFQRQELLKQQELIRDRQSIAAQQAISKLQLHQNEFIEPLGVTVEPARNAVISQSVIQTRNSKQYQDTIRKRKQLQREIDMHRHTQAPPKPTINYEKALAADTFNVFISRKLDDILGVRPNRRTIQLERLSMVELRALQTELRMRLVKGNGSTERIVPETTLGIAKQEYPANAIGVATDSRPIQNIIQPEAKLMMSEFHIPNEVTRTKIIGLSTTNEFKSEDTKKFKMDETKLILASSNEIIPAFKKTKLTHIARPSPQTSTTKTATTKITQRPITKTTTTTQATTTENTTTQPTEATTKQPTTTSKITTPPPPPQTTTTTTSAPITTTPTTTRKPTNPTTVLPTTTTVLKTTITRSKPTESMTTESTTESTTIESTTVSHKSRIPIKPVWTVYQDVQAPWKRWMTKSPRIIEPETTTRYITRKPSHQRSLRPQTKFLVESPIRKTKHLVTKETSHQKLRTSENDGNRRYPSIKQTAQSVIKQEPTAFVNVPVHYDVGVVGQSDEYTGVGFNMRRFNSPVRPFYVQAQPTSTKSSSLPTPPTLPTTTIATTTTELPTTTTLPPSKQTSLTRTPVTQTAKRTDLLNTYNNILQSQYAYDSMPRGQPSGTTRNNNAPFKVTYSNNGVNQQIIASHKQILQRSDVSHMTLAPILSPENQWYETPVAQAQVPKSVSSNTPAACLQEVNCMRPNCVCKTTSAPGGLPLADTPQIVYITIDGSLNYHTYGKMRSMFSPSRKNPNGCKIKGTVFATDSGSSYRIAKVLQAEGIEVAMMGDSSRPYTDATKMGKDAVVQRKRIAVSTNILPSEVKGWRSPGFSPVGDEQFDILSNMSLYDSSLILPSNAKDLPKFWPHTLDFGWNAACERGKCPLKPHNGVWEVPVIPFSGPNNSSACEYIDACTLHPETEQETIDFLMDNFNAYYKTNRAPFAIRLKQMWFHWYYRDNLSGLFKFLDMILNLGDVYITSVSGMLEWIKSPKTVRDIKHFIPWKC